MSQQNANTTAVYPRSRGEHTDYDAAEQLRLGLSPLARGTHMESLQCISNGRFIPASAGNTQFQQHRLLLPGGLPPLARGTLLTYIAVKYDDFTLIKNHH